MARSGGISAAPASASLPLTIAAVTEVPTLRKVGRLLLVEDVEINQELARAVLEAVGHTVDIVSDGASGVAAVQAGGYDLVLMDVQMPGMDGMTATRLIRELDHPARSLPIVAMTANVLPDEIIQFRRSGMNDHVGKPFNRADLYGVIDRWLPGAPMADRLEPSADAEHPGVDPSIFDGLVDLHTPAGVARLLGFLEEEIGRSFRRDVETADGRASVRREAHVLVSAAGMLGFLALSAACSELESCGEPAVLDGGESPFLKRLDQVRTLAAAAVAESRRLSERLKPKEPESPPLAKRG